MCKTRKIVVHARKHVKTELYFWGSMAFGVSLEPPLIPSISFPKAPIWHS